MTSERTILTDAIAARLVPVWGTKVYIGRVRANELEAPCVILLPGEERPKTSELRGNVEIDYSITALKKRSEATNEEYEIIDELIDNIRYAVEACGLQAFSIHYDGARPIYKEGGDLIGAELRYSIATPYIQHFGE